MCSVCASVRVAEDVMSNAVTCCNQEDARVAQNLSPDWTVLQGFHDDSLIPGPRVPPRTWLSLRLWFDLHLLLALCSLSSLFFPQFFAQRSRTVPSWTFRNVLLFFLNANQHRQVGRTGSEGRVSPQNNKQECFHFISTSYYYRLNLLPQPLFC